MKKLFTKVLDKTFWLYVGLGFLNYGFCSVVMLLFQYVVQLGEVPCLWISFFLQTAISFVLNRFVTFRGITISKLWPLKFVCSIAVCYVVAKILLRELYHYLMTLPFFYGIADWLHTLMKSKATTPDFRLSLVMLASTFTYCVLNYIGQRYFVFRKTDTK